jgi:hypothetical protein
MSKILPKRLVVCLIILLVSSIFALFSYRVLTPVLKNIQLERYVYSNMSELYENSELYYDSTGPLTQITSQIADDKSFGTIFINPDKMNNLSENSKNIKDIKVIENKDKRAIIALRDSKTNKLLGIYNLVTTDSSIVNTFGEQDDQKSILEPENNKLDIEAIMVKGAHGFTDLKEFLDLSRINKITYSKLDLDSDSPKYKEHSFTLGDLPEVKQLINEYNSKYSKNKLSLEYLNESTYNKLIRTQMENTKNITGVPAHTIVLIVFLVIFAYTIYAILYLTQMKA